MEAILVAWEAFAAIQLPAARHMKPLALRDHAREILQAVSKDISTPQSRETQTEKSLGLAPISSGAPETAAQTHGFLRAKSGFDINQLAAEYRAFAPAFFVYGTMTLSRKACIWTTLFASMRELTRRLPNP
jgi:hypothetical protein